MVAITRGMLRNTAVAAGLGAAAGITAMAFADPGTSFVGDAERRRIRGRPLAFAGQELLAPAAAGVAALSTAWVVRKLAMGYTRAPARWLAGFALAGVAPALIGGVAARMSAGPEQPPALARDPEARFRTLVLVYRSMDVPATEHHTGQKSQMSDDEIRRAREVIDRFDRSMTSWSDGAVDIEPHVVVVDRPLTSLAHRPAGDDHPADNHPWRDQVAPELEQLEDARYDSVIVLWKDDDNAGGGIRSTMGGWGAGPGDRSGASLASVHIPNAGKPWTGADPEEILVHEFLHGVEGYAELVGSPIHSLHDAGAYRPWGGSWRLRYSDYMTDTVGGVPGRGVSRQTWEAIGDLLERRHNPRNGAGSGGKRAASAP